LLLAEYVGQPDQQYKLATTYYDGDFVPQNYAEAIKWYRKAANQRFAAVQHSLGLMFDKGEGVQRDYTKAVIWYRKAAEQGVVSAQFDLGNKYAVGKGIPQNFIEAYVWYSLAAASGHQKSLKQRDHFARKLSREEIIEAQRRAMELFEGIQQKKTGK
jgi:TPR repeat protein